MGINLQVHPHLPLIPFSLCKKLSGLFTKRKRLCAFKEQEVDAWHNKVKVCTLLNLRYASYN